MIQLTDKQLQQDLAELFDCQAFELYREKNSDETENFIIPYMMNDALECYLLLKDGTLTGQYLPDCKEPVTVQMTAHQQLHPDASMTAQNSRSALIIRQGDTNVFTIWFASAWKIQHCYQYHSIGHLWVKGQEQWRQLVYIIGTLCDKYDYFGEKMCSEKEMELLPLMGFGPFRMWSPIHESLDDRYPESLEGARLMYHYAYTSGHKFFARFIRLYMHFPISTFATFLGKWMNRAGMEDLYQLICKKVTEASLSYPIRDYGQEMNTFIKKSRCEVTDYLHKNGFHGNYPYFQKGNLQIAAAEEHPFTLMEMEYKDFNFRIQFMVSECEDGCQAHNAGFFRGKKRKGWICSDLTNLISSLSPSQTKESASQAPQSQQTR